MKIGWVWRVLVAWLVFVVAEMVAGMLLPIKMPMAPHAMQWLLAANLLSVVALSSAAVKSGWSRARLLPALFGLGFGIALVNGIEASFFLNFPEISWARVILQQGIAQAILSATVTLLFGGRHTQDESQVDWLGGRPVASAIGRFLASDALYVVIYFAFGMLVVPFVREWYATQHIPAFKTIVTLQFLLRGPVFVGLSILLARMLKVRGAAGALLVGLIFTTLTGITQLMVPSAVFPDAVRWAHFCEVSSSMFLFGFVISMLWRPKPQGIEAARVVVRHA